MLIACTLGLTSVAQTTLNTTVGSTGFTGTNSCGSGSGGSCYITFAIENSSAAGILLTDVGQWTSTANNANTVDLYYSATSLSGSPGGAFNTTTPPAGWSVVASGTIAGITTTQVNTVLSNMSFLIPAGTTYRFAIVPSGTVSYSGTGVGTASPNTVSNGGVNLRVGDYQIASAYVGYGGANNPRFFTGSVTFVPAGPCTNPPLAGTATTNKSITCSGESFILGLTGFTSGTGQTHQWQISPDNINWTNIVGATSTNYSTSQTTTNYYRCQVTCGVTVSSTSVQISTTAVALPGGTYTINGNLATGGTNFNSFSDFKQAIVCGGIAGPVVVNVISKGSAYNEQIALGAIGGSSATNTITINGGGQTLSFGGGTQYATLLFNGTQHVKVKNLKVEGTGTTNNYGIHLTGGARYIEIDSCTVSINPLSTSSLTAAFVVSASLTSATTSGVSARNITVKNSIIEGGYYCFTLMGNTAAPYSHNNLIQNNTIRDFYLYGMYTSNQDSTIIKGNDINRAQRTGTITTFYGMFLTGNMTDVQVLGNKIHNNADQNPIANFTAYSLYMSAANATAADPMLVANNAIYELQGIGTNYTIYLASGNFINLYHNTVSINNSFATASASVQRALFVGASTGTFQIKNNIFMLSHVGTGAKHVVYFSSTVPTFTINNNQYHLNSSTGTNFISYWNAANVATFAAWQAVNSGAFEQNGVNGDPVMNTSNYVPQSPVGNGAGANLLADVPVDIFGAARTTTPDIGAAEYTPLPCLQPYGIVGTATLNSVTLNWTNVSGADSVRIEYAGTGFTQGTGTAIFVTGSTTTITGLNSQTCYDFYLTTYCGGTAGNGTTLYTICTPCGNQAMPYQQSFSTWAPQCFDLTGTSTWNWQHNSSSYAMAPFWSFSTGQATMKTATVAITQAAQVNFKWAHAYNTSYPNDRLVVRAQKVGTTVWDTLFDMSGATFNSPNSGTTTPPASAADFIQHTSYLSPSYVGGNAFVEFIGITGFGPNVFIDDFEVVAVPPCTPPFTLGVSSITASGATLNWTTIAGVCFKVEYGPLGFIQGTGQGTIINNIPTNSTTLTGLSPNTFYSYYVADCCNPNVWSGPFTFKTNCLAQLSGAYTVGGTAGPTNFATIDSAIAVLTGCGISGPVTFNLQGAAVKSMSGKTINDINGASATNTVTFNGRGIGLDTLKFNAGTTIGFTFSGTSYVTFQNMTINATTVDRPIWLTANAQYLTFNNCHILGNATSVSSVSCVITASGSATSNTTAGNNANNITITNCKLSGGYYGVVLYGPSTTTYSTGFTLTNNELVDQYYYGIMAYYVGDVNVQQNKVKTFRNTSAYGYYGFYNSNVTLKRNEFMAPTYGVYLSNFNTTNAPTTSSEISNNFMSGGTYGMYLSGYNLMNLYHNSIRGNTAGFYSFTPGATLDMRNNIFVANTSYAWYCGTNITTLTLNNNLYHTNSTTAFAFNGAAHANLAAWKTAQPTLNTNSVSGDPGFLSLTDFHIVGTLPNGLGDNAVPVVIDIDGDTRPIAGSTTKDIGADEYTPLNWDASLEAVVVALGGCGNAATSIDVVVKNLGLNTITSLPISVNLTGGITTVVSTTATVSIPVGVIDTIPVGTFNTYAGAAGVNFAATVSLVGDQKASNDSKTVGPGNYIPAEPVTHGIVDTFCASVDSVDLYAIYIPGTSYAWYNVLTGGTKFADGDSITVPTSGQTTYYVGFDSTVVNPQVGAGTTVSTSTYITPYKTFYMDGRAQYLVLASELAALGVTGGGEISSLAFEVATAAAQTMNAFTINMGGTTTTQMTSTFQPNGGMTTVFSSTVAAVAGWNVHTFTTPFIWNGSDNILIEICYDNSSYTSNSSVYYTTTSFPSVTDGYADLSSTSGCTPGNITNQQVSTSRPNMKFNVKTIACSNVRKPVSFALNPDTAHAAFTSAVQSNGADVNFDGSASTGDVYDWNFGDGNTGTGVTTTHTYATAGTFTACLTITDLSCGDVDSICKTVVTTIGIDESLLSQSLNLFPNPSNGKFRVEFTVEGLKDVTVRVSTLLGQEIYESKPGKVSGNYREDIDLSNEASAVYILQIITDDNVVSKRFTIRK